MEKSKLGISVRLFGSLLFFIGAANNLLLAALAAGYVLFFENDEWLKKTALKALIFTVLLTIIVFLVNSLIVGTSYLFSFFNWLNMAGVGNTTITNNGALFSILQSFAHMFQPIVQIVQAIIFIILGFRTYKQQDIKIKWIDNIVDKNYMNLK